MNTENEAYRAMADSGLLRKTQIAVIEALEGDSGKTAGEIARDLDRRINSVSPRLAELKKLGMVKTTTARPCQVTRQTCLTWILTGLGPRRSLGDTLLRLRLPGAESESVLRELNGNQKHLRRLAQFWLEQGARNWLELRSGNRGTSPEAGSATAREGQSSLGSSSEQ